jgi:SAM-dependent methyltransferase
VQTWEALHASLQGPPGAVLDVGGAGPLGCALARLGWSVSDSSVDLRGPLPFADGSFDLVVCTEVIEHIKDVESARIEDLEAFNYSGVENLLRELRRGLRPGGRLIVTTPNAASWHTLSKWLYGELLLSDPNHVREFTAAELERVARHCGLAPVWIRGVESWDLGHTAASDALRRRIEEDAAFAAFSGVDRRDNLIALFERAEV